MCKSVDIRAKNFCSWSPGYLKLHWLLMWLSERPDKTDHMCRLISICSGSIPCFPLFSPFFFYGFYGFYFISSISRWGKLRDPRGNASNLQNQPISFLHKMLVQARTHSRKRQDVHPKVQRHDSPKDNKPNDYAWARTTKKELWIISQHS